MTVEIDVGTNRTGPVQALVDASDEATVRQFRWRATRRRKVFYVRTLIEGEQVLLHRFLMSASQGETVDHIDGNPLNNTRANLRLCSQSENTRFAHDRGAYADWYGSATHAHVVKKRLADGSIKEYRYDRREHAKRT